MSFIKIQRIDPNTISNPDAGHVYIGQDMSTSGSSGFWQKDEWGNVFNLNGGGGVGTSGTSGFSGSSGVDGNFLGSSGTAGTAGTSGKSGISGSSGITGTSGSTGTSGTSGSSGNTGSSGTTGSSGETGTSGTSGADGNFYGSSGTSGSSGLNGGYGAATRLYIFSGYTIPDENYFFGWNDTYLTSNFNLLEYVILNKIDADDRNLQFWIDTWRVGILKIENRNDFSNFGLYSVNTTPQIIGNTLKVDNLVCLASNGSLIENDYYFISFISSIGDNSGLTEDVVVAKDGGGTIILHFVNGLYTGKT